MAYNSEPPEPLGEPWTPRDDCDYRLIGDEMDARENAGRPDLVMLFVYFLALAAALVVLLVNLR